MIHQRTNRGRSRFRLFFFWLLVLFVAGGNLFLIPNTDAQPGPPPSSRQKLKIGFIGAFSGGKRALGLAAQEGFELALRKSTPSYVDVIYEDDEGDGIKALAAFHKLRTQNKVHAVIAVGEHGSSLLHTAADEFHIPLFLWASVGKANGPDTFAIQTKINPLLQGKYLALETGRRGYKRIAIAYSATPELEKVLEGFKAVTKPEHIVAEEIVGDSPDDLQQFLQSARSKQATAIGLFLKNGRPSAIARETRSSAYLADLFGTDSLLSHKEVRLSRDTLLGAWCVGVDVLPSFRENYMQRFREGAFIKVAAVHHDLARLLNDIAKNSTNRSEMMKLIVHGSVEMGVLKHFQIARIGAGHSVLAPLTIYEATEEGFRPIAHPPHMAMQQ